MSTVKACSIGTGGVGTIAALASEQSGKCEVTVVSRSIYERVSKEGFEIQSIDYGDIKNWKPSHITNSVDAAAEYGPFDYVVVSTKNIPEVQKTEDVIRPLVKPGTAVVLVQNGIGGEETLMEVFPEAYIIGGISMIGSASYHGQIRHTGHDHSISGTYDERPEAKAAVEKFNAIYGATKSTSEIVDDSKYRRWCKLVYNSCYNTIAALTGLDTGRSQSSDSRNTSVLPAMREVRTIAEAELKRKLPADIEEYMSNSDEGVYFAPSMLVDVRKGQPMELEVILGNPLRIAKKVGVEAPISTTVYKSLHGKQFFLMDARGKFDIPPEPFNKDGMPEPILPIHL